VISVEKALGILEAASEPLDAESVPLGDALGRVLAGGVDADRDFPPTDRSAMDGFAVRAADLGEPDRSLRLIGEVRAGESVAARRVGSGETLRIFTGAVVPPGADAVVMVEDTHEDEAAGRVHFRVAAEAGRHIRRRGEELVRGQTVVEAGGVIRAAEVAALASVGAVRVDVHRRPAVRVLTTGDEVIEPGEEPADHQVRNSNGWTLLAQLREIGIEADYLGIAGDERSRLDTALEAGFGGDVLLITGGVSVGAYDLVGRALEDAGMNRLFHGVAVKPGKPLLAGTLDGCLVFGLPGNPVSTYTTFAIFVAPVLRRLMGVGRWENRVIPAELETPIRGRKGRRTYHLATLRPGPRGLCAREVTSAGSGDVLSLARANGCIERPADRAELEAGSTARTLLWGDL
jgi:molybdopterin molybdotransferase